MQETVRVLRGQWEEGGGTGSGGEGGVHGAGGGGERVGE